MTTDGFIVAKLPWSENAELAAQSILECLYAVHLSAEARLPYRPLAKIQAIQNQRVRAMIAHAYETVPYYREVMDKTGLRPFSTVSTAEVLPLSLF